MKLGLLTDIHEQVEFLRAALTILHREKVDQIIVIGDVVEIGDRIDETCRLLAEAGAVGVWGNHDYGLCVGVDDQMRAEYAPHVIQYMSTLRPRLEISGCHFTHIEPWLNPESIEDLWYFEGAPDQHRNLARIFNAVPTRFIFVGHYHKWLVARPDKFEDWRGESPLRLSGRNFIVIGALCEGQFATFDTDTTELVPFNLNVL